MTVFFILVRYYFINLKVNCIGSDRGIVDSILPYHTSRTDFDSSRGKKIIRFLYCALSFEGDSEPASGIPA